MPPQPLSNVPHSGAIVIGNIGHNPLRERRDLALKMAEVIASWSIVESFQLNLFMTLLGGPSTKAADIFRALEARSARIAAIRAAAQTLPKDYQDLLSAILAITKTREKARDKIAHGIWGICTGLPDALLLAAPRDLIERVDDRKIFVYWFRDFAEMIKANERLAGFGFDFNVVISGYSEEQGRRRYGQLCAEPEIAEKLNQMARQSPKAE